MPELPEVELYVRALRARLLGQQLQRIQILSPSLLRTFEPPASVLTGLAVQDVRRLGKRIVLAFPPDYFVVLHLMIAGRLKWRERARAPSGGRATAHPAGRRPRNLHAVFTFGTGELQVTEAGTRKRAALHVLAGREALAALDRGGVEPLATTPAEFREALLRENHTLKRALTDPRLFSGIGNAHSDEILFRARLSPARRTRQLTEAEIGQLHAVMQVWLQESLGRLLAEAGDRFPEKVTAFHPQHAVHGRFGQPCPVCGAPIQRIVYAQNETNYCARCQTGGRLLADRAFSRLLREDWPRTLEELEG